MESVFKDASPKMILFDFMGTCLDWHTPMIPVLTSAFETASKSYGSKPPNREHISAFALRWRQGFFDEVAARSKQDLPLEDIDVTHRRVLDGLLKEESSQNGWTSGMRDECVQQWHKQVAWPDVITALPKLRKQFDIVVLANGTPRLQVDLAKHSGLEFDLLLSSELLGLGKPDLKAYERAVQLMKRDAEECVMVAAHAYDLRAAKKVGIKTVYLQRWTEDPTEDMPAVNSDVDYFIDGRGAVSERGGMEDVVKLLGCSSLKRTRDAISN
ncbi:haloacid dehalogenase [Polychaeton citri CBS 116435]|uniref:Haloacid dehalogenase n=1 Tax=Polychaeton citri CBS 116435 TaxID=1314669 RepID=A0A9P4UPL8_9PEZI|nr:haloacid dehalogenase [Polychaeton citri CBS 116435]